MFKKDYETTDYANGNFHPCLNCVIQATKQRNMEALGCKYYLFAVAAHYFERPENEGISPDQITYTYCYCYDRSRGYNKKSQGFYIFIVVQEQKDKHHN